MRRRDLLAGIALTPAALKARAACAQGQQLRRIGVLWIVSSDDVRGRADREAFGKQLQQLGWIQGLNIAIDYRWAAGDVARAGVLANELVGSAPDLIVTEGTPGVAALKKATQSIPIVFANVTDPLGQGLVDNLGRPGGNVTGLALFEPEIGGKWLELLREVAPGAKRAAVLFNPGMAPYSELYLNSLRAAGPAFGVEPFPLPVADQPGVQAAMLRLSRESETALIVLLDAFTFGQRDTIARMAIELRVPAVYSVRMYVDSGGLASYGADFSDQYRQVAFYADRILRGSKPAELPVQRPTKFELVVNLTTAKAMGLALPTSLLVRADEVIE